MRRRCARAYFGLLDRLLRVMSDMTANHVGQNTCDWFKSSSSCSRSQSTLTASPPNPFLVSLGWRSSEGLCPTYPVLVVPHRTNPAVGSHIYGDTAWTIRMNLAAVNQNSPEFRMCGVRWGCPVSIQLSVTEVADSCLSLLCDNGADTAIVGLIRRLVVPDPAMWRPRSARIVS
jgi:hypothetical protein